MSLTRLRLLLNIVYLPTLPMLGRLEGRNMNFASYISLAPLAYDANSWHVKTYARCDDIRKSNKALLIEHPSFIPVSSHGFTEQPAPRIKRLNDEKYSK